MALAESFFKTEKVVQISSKDLLSWIFDNQHYDQDAPVYIDAADSSHSLSSRQCRTLVRKLIAGLKALGLRKGDCVCVHAFNNMYYSCLFLATVGAGLVWTGTNPGYTQYEIAHHLNTSKAKLLVADPDLYETIFDTARKSGMSSENILIFDSLRSQPDSSPVRSWTSLLKHGQEDWERFDDLSIATNTVACTLYSSGTTGLPKAAAVSHYNLVAQHTLVHEQVAKPFQIRRILCLPFFHAAMVPIAHTTPLRSGHVSFIMRRFELQSFLQNVERYQISELFLVPPIVNSIINSPLKKEFSMKSVQWGSIGGAPLDTVSQAKFNALIHPEGKISSAWGMTECTCLGACFNWPELDTTGSIGRFLPNLEVKLIGEDGEEVRAYDARGELYIRGPTVIKGYHDNPLANAGAFKDGWFVTGDIAYCDGTTKKWYIVDRKKELIKVRGFQVAPPELEAVLLSNPQLSDAAVIGVPLPQLAQGEVPRAYVVRSSSPEGKAATEDSVKEYVAKRLVKYKHLDGGVVFVDEIPKTASGKYLKRFLRERAKKEIKTARL